VKPAKVAGIALNTHGLDDDAARAAIERARGETGLPCDDVVRHGPHDSTMRWRPRSPTRRRPSYDRAPLDRALARARRCAFASLAFYAPGARASMTGGTPGGKHPWTVPGHLRIGSPDEPDNINPMFAHTDATDQVDALIFAPLFRYDRTAISCRSSRPSCPPTRTAASRATRRRSCCTCATGVRWSDGAPLTARDLRFTWRAVIDRATTRRPLYGWDDIARSTCRTTTPRSSTQTQPNAERARHLRRRRRRRVSAAARASARQAARPQRRAFNAAPISSGPFLCARGTTARRSSSCRIRATGAGRRSFSGISWKIVPNPDTLFEQLRHARDRRAADVDDTF
jgi:hypothetical protein